MADASSDSDDIRARPDGGPIGAPRWVKVLGLVMAVLVVLVVAIMLLGGGEHGPGRHAPSPAGPTPSSAVMGDPAPDGGRG